jgi:hypothetical protein
MKEKGGSQPLEELLVSISQVSDPMTIGIYELKNKSFAQSIIDILNELANPSPLTSHRRWLNLPVNETDWISEARQPNLQALREWQVISRSLVCGARNTL